MKAPAIIAIVCIVVVSFSATSYVLLNQSQTPPSNQDTLAPSPDLTMTSPASIDTTKPSYAPTQNPTTNPSNDPMTNPTVSPSPTPAPTDYIGPVTTIPSFALDVGNSGYGTSDYTCWITITVAPLDEGTVSAYKIEYKRPTDTLWSYLAIVQQDAIVIDTPNLIENTEYEVRVAGVSHLGEAGTFSEIQTITTLPNNVPYPVPEGVSAIDTIKGVEIVWDDLAVDGYNSASYNVYKSITNDISTATKTANTIAPWYEWKVSDVTHDYVTQYFWVTSVSPSGIESSKCTVVSAVPIAGV